jgi:hypothetical protein
MSQINLLVYSENHFKLRTLHCNRYLDVAGIIIEQPELQILGIYSNGDYDTLIDTLEHVQLEATPRLHSLLPTLFAFQRDTFLPVYDYMAIFPAFSPDPWLAITESFDTDVARNISLEKQSVSGVDIYLRDFSDMAFVRRLVEEMIQNFPAVHNVGFLLQRSPRVVSPHSKLQRHLT